MPFEAFYHVATSKKSLLSPQKKNRNFPRGNSEEYVAKRMRDRKAAMSEGSVTFSVLLKTFFLFELPPMFIGFLLCWAVEGYTSASSRTLSPPSLRPGGLLAWVFFNFLISLSYIAVVMGFALKSGDETEWSIVLPLQICVYYILWKFTLAAKHSLSSTLDHSGLYGLDSVRYVQARRLERNQFSCWIQNNGSNQPGAVLEELYTASLRADCDLSKLQFDVGSETIARKIVKHVVRWKLKAATSLIFNGAASEIPEWHPRHPAHPNMRLLEKYMADHAGEGKEVAPVVEAIKEGSGNGAPSPYTVPKEQAVSMDIVAENRLPTLSVSKYAEDDDFCLFRQYFGETNDPEGHLVETMVKDGKVPATYICFLVGVENWKATKDGLFMGVFMFSSLFMAFLPSICRAIFREDHLAFGRTQNARLVFGFGLLGSFFPIMLLFGYLLNCTKEMYFRLSASRFMKNMLLPEGASVDDTQLYVAATSPKAKKGVTTGPGSHSSPGINIHISLKRQCNIVAWGATRELMHGAAFCPFMHSKTQAYVACSFAAAILVTSVSSVGAAILGGDTGGVQVALPAVINSIFFSLALGVYVLTAYSVNFSTRYQRQEIAKARLAVLSEIGELERELDLKVAQDTGGLDSKALQRLRTKVKEMNNCSMILQVVDKQTTVSDHANPVKAMGLVADPAVLSIMVSILAASVWIEIQKVSGSFGAGSGV